MTLRNIRSTIVVVISAALIMFFSPAGQDALADILIRSRTEAERAQFSRAAQRTMEDAARRFRPFLTPDQARVAASVRFEAPLTTSFGDAYATITNGVRRIVIGVGFLEAIEMVEDGAILTISFGVGNVDTLRRYTDYVADRIAASRSLGATGGATPIRPYWSFANASEQQVNQIYGSDFYQSVRLRTRIETLTLIAGHELGHHVLGHLESRPSRNSSPEQRAAFIMGQEAEADAFGLRLAVAINDHLFFSWAPFALFASLEGLPTPTSDHPPGGCRGGLVMQKALELALTTPEGQQNFNGAARQAIAESARVNDAFLASNCGR